MQTPNLNEFSSFSDFSTYNQRYHEREEFQVIQRRNPLEYYTKHNLEIPKTIHGDPVKILTPVEPVVKTVNQPLQVSTTQTIHKVENLAHEVDRVCRYASEMLGHKIEIKKQVIIEKEEKQVDKMEQTKEKPKNEPDEWTKLKDQLKNQGINDVEKEFNEFIQYRNSLTQLPQMPQKVHSPDTTPKSMIFFDHTVKLPERKPVAELYKRQKRITPVEEAQQARSSRSSKTLGSVNQFEGSANTEIQKAMQVLMGPRVQGPK